MATVLLLLLIVGVPVPVNPEWLSTSWFALLGLTIVVSVGILGGHR